MGRMQGMVDNSWVCYEFTSEKLVLDHDLHNTYLLSMREQQCI